MRLSFINITHTFIPLLEVKTDIYISHDPQSILSSINRHNKAALSLLALYSAIETVNVLTAGNLQNSFCMCVCVCVCVCARILMLQASAKRRIFLYQLNMNGFINLLVLAGSFVMSLSR
jgi:hypothetical protein